MQPNKMMGKQPGKCKEIGHVIIPQFNYAERMIEYFCFNCAAKSLKKPFEKYTPAINVEKINLANAIISFCKSRVNWIFAKEGDL